MEIGIIVLLALVVIYTILGHTLARIWITMPMFFVIAGAIAGPHGLGWISFGLEAPDVETLIELTLALLLFADAATLNFNQVREDAKLPGPVYSGSVDQVIGNSVEELPEEEYAVSAKKARDDQRGIGVRQSGLDGHHVQRDHKNRKGDHHRAKEGGEYRVPPPEREFGKYVAQ